MGEFFLDVNVSMYAAGKAHDYKASCVWVMTEIAEGHLETVIDTEIIQEILYRYGAIRQKQLGVQLAGNLLSLIPHVYPVTLEDSQLTIQLFDRHFDQGLTARDAIHIAVMKNRDIKEIISTDAHFDVLKGIKRIDPKTLYKKRQRKT